LVIKLGFALDVESLYGVHKGAFSGVVQGFHDRVHRSDRMISLEQEFRKLRFGVVMSVFSVMFFITD
jgi:hypothetical protein